MVENPELSEGDEVHVTVSTALDKTQRSAAEILARSPGNQTFKTVEEADDYLRQERGSWHS